MLIETMYEDFIYIDITRSSDGLGGFEEVQQEGKTIKAALTSAKTRVREVETMAGQEISSPSFTITTSQENPLPFNQILKRVSNGNYYIIDSRGSDKTPPETSSFNWHQAAVRLHILG